MTREFEPDVEPFDLIVIGSGPAGEKAAAKAAYLGKRIALVERSQQSVGGVAVTRVGMVPTKTLRESALYLTEGAGGAARSTVHPCSWSRPRSTSSSASAPTTSARP